MIYPLLLKKCCESHCHTSMGQICQDVWIGGWGDQPNLGNACILGTFGTATPPLVSYWYIYLCSLSVCLDLGVFSQRLHGNVIPSI